MMGNPVFLSWVLMFSFCSFLQAAELNPLIASSVKYREVRVARVLAVDRLLLENGEEVSLAGIKGPKLPKQKEMKRDDHGFLLPEDDPTTSFEETAVRFARGITEGKTVRLEFDVQRRDDNGDLQGYVFLNDGTLVNAELLRNGYADLKLVPPNMKHADELRSAYQEARREMRGMQGDW